MITKHIPVTAEASILAADGVLVMLLSTGRVVNVNGDVVTLLSVTLLSVAFPPSSDKNSPVTLLVPFSFEGEAVVRLLAWSNGLVVVTASEMHVVVRNTTQSA